MAGIYTRRVGLVTRTHLINSSSFITALQDFYTGKHRLIFAFRHLTHADGPLLYRAFTRQLHRLAHQEGRPLPTQPHVHFMYDRGITLWAGSYLEWLLPFISATPILRGKADRQGVAAARQLIAAGGHPLAVAPEGGINNLNYALGPLQPGLMQLAGWAQDDLAAKGHSVPIAIMPVGLIYKYEQAAYPRFDALLAELENTLSLPSKPAHPARCEPGFCPDQIDDPALQLRYTRYLAIHATMLNYLEDYYRENHYRKYLATAPAESLDGRTIRLSDLAFSIAEESLKVTGRGTTTDRIYAIEQAAWAKIYRNTPPTPLQKGLADWAASDAHSAARHMRLASSLHRISLDYLFAEPGFERLADITLLTWDVMARCLNLRDKLMLGPRQAYLTAGEPIVLAPASERADRKAALAHAHETLCRGMAALIPAPAKPALAYASQVCS